MRKNTHYCTILLLFLLILFTAHTAFCGEQKYDYSFFKKENTAPKSVLQNKDVIKNLSKSHEDARNNENERIVFFVQFPSSMYCYRIDDYNYKAKIELKIDDAMSVTVSSGALWEIKKVYDNIVHMRMDAWKNTQIYNSFWEVDLNNNRVYRIINGIFGKAYSGERQEMQDIHPYTVATGFYLSFTSIFVYNSDLKKQWIDGPDTAQISFGGEWNVNRISPNTFSIKEESWTDAALEIDIIGKLIYKVINPYASQGNGKRVLLNLKVNVTK